MIYLNVDQIDWVECINNHRLLTFATMDSPQPSMPAEQPRAPKRKAKEQFVDVDDAPKTQTYAADTIELHAQWRQTATELGKRISETNDKVRKYRALVQAAVHGQRSAEVLHLCQLTTAFQSKEAEYSTLLTESKSLAESMDAMRKELPSFVPMAYPGSCSICLTSLTHAAPHVRLGCRHVLCLKDFLELQKSPGAQRCPECRALIPAGLKL